MRLIDATALTEQIQKLSHNEYMVNWLGVLIDAQPTVKVEPIEVPKPVRHGKWKKAEPHGVWVYSDAYRQCSECNDVIYMAFRMQYCPTCGSKMDAERKEE